MMLTVDSAAAAPPPGPRSGGRTNGATDSTFQDYLDDVPTPDAEPPRSNRTSTERAQDDSRTAERQRKSRRPAEDAWNVAPPPFMPPVVPNASDRPNRAVTSRPSHAG